MLDSSRFFPSLPLLFSILPRSFLLLDNLSIGENPYPSLHSLPTLLCASKMLLDKQQRKKENIYLKNTVMILISKINRYIPQVSFIIRMNVRCLSLVRLIRGESN